jgi:hypothetical protein
MTARSFRWTWAVLGILSLLGFAGVTAAQQEEPPKPGPEHATLKKMEGTWEANIKASFGPGEPTESKGTAVYKMECGGLWLTGDFKGSFAGMPFQGKSFETYDAGKKKYLSVWVDSMATLPMLSEGTYDKEKQTLTMKAEYPGPDGKPTKYTMVTTMKDDDTMLFTMSTPDKDGKDTVMMTITYKRKK